MTLAQFVAEVQAGRILRGAGGQVGDVMVDGDAPLEADDPDAITAEAYNQEIIPPTMPWDMARAQVVAALGVDVDEAVTRTKDGKFASQGPCPEDGCGLDQGHPGTHKYERFSTTGVPTLRPETFTPAPTFAMITEAQDWWAANYATVNASALFNPEYQLSDVNAIVQTWHDLAQRFPEVAAGVSEIGTRARPDRPDDIGVVAASRGWLAAAQYRPTENTMVLWFNDAYLRGTADGVTLASAQSHHYRSGFLSTPDVAGLAAHEFGHLVHYHYQDRHRMRAFTPWVRASGFGITGDTMQGWVSYMQKTRQEPSEYAKTNDREFFAETFGAWYNRSVGTESRATLGVYALGNLLRAAKEAQPTGWDFQQNAPTGERTEIYSRLAHLARNLGFADPDMQPALKGST